MNSIIPADLFELKARLETWRTNRKYMREPIPDELWNVAADLGRRYPPSLVGRVLKLDPSKLKKLLIKRSARHSTRKKPQAAFFHAESVELWSGSFIISDGTDSTRRAAQRRERAGIFCLFQARLPQAHGR